MFKKHLMVRIGFLAVLLFPLVRVAQAASEQSSAPKDTLYFVPHTHWEGAVFITREDYLQSGLVNIARALNLLKTYPNYKFTLDQVAYFKPFLERYPEEEASFKKFIAEGRLQIVGGMDNMPDDNMPPGELFVRNMLYGKGYCREKLGVDVTAGWLLDTFGHNGQLPQLLKLAGFKSLWFSRGVSGMDVPSEFLWEGVDGTKINAFWLPAGYGFLYGSPVTFPEFADFLKRRFNLLTPFSHGPNRVGLAGADVSVPEEHLPGLIEKFNKEGNASFAVKLAVPADFEAVVAKRNDLPTIKGELNPIFQGIYSSRIEVKQWTRNLTRILTTAEKLGALSNWLGTATDDAMVWRAWEPTIFNQTHDLASGVMSDRVYEDSIRGFEFSKALGDEMVDTRFETLASKIDTRGEGIPVVVFNSLGWPRTDISETDLFFSDSGVRSVSLMDPDGKEIPIQALEVLRSGDGSIKQLKVAFVAKDVPALGYSVYHAIPNHPSSLTNGSDLHAPDRWMRRWMTSTSMEDTDSIENEFYKVTFNMWTGAMTGLQLKADQSEFLSGPGNVVARELDGGDFWELYGGLNGGRLISMKTPHFPPKPGMALFSNQQVGGSGGILHGPVFSEYSVNHVFGNGHFGTSVKVYNGIPRIDVTTRILNQEKFVRYRALFPTTIQNGQYVAEIPFGAIERPIGIELPAQNWMDYGDGKRGLALLNQGLPGNNVSEGTMMLSLLRSAVIGAYASQPVAGFDPSMSSDTGFELGKTMTLQYALVPHTGSWKEAGVYRAGWEFNHPLMSRKSVAHSGSLPKRWGLLQVSDPNVVVSALKPGPHGSVILRVYEAGGKSSAGVKVKIQTKVVSANESNLVEETGAKMAIANDTLQFNLHPFEVKTFQLQLETQEKKQ
ncbi:MAG: glycoside hydrolase family 38 C-terminal domain-containing protein [Terriglobia bacterium]